MEDDRTAIIAVLNRYADACDTRDWALFERVFTPDVTSDYGPGYQRADRAVADRCPCAGLSAERVARRPMAGGHGARHALGVCPPCRHA